MTVDPHPPGERLDAYVTGSLPPEDRRQLDTHLSACASCREQVESRISGPTHRPAPLDQTVESGPSRPREVSAPLGVGQRVGRYVVVGLLGQGAMGVVYAAFDPTLDRKVALKLLRADLPQLESQALRERLLREAQALARLRHPNVLAIHDAGDFGDAVFIAMEHVEGQHLARWLQERPRTVREVLGVFRQAGEGLAAAHRAGLVHRDFKPENVLVGADGVVRVADFGLARRVRRDDASAPRMPGAVGETVGLIGTPAYMAPDQLEGKPATARSDQFSFCVALWEALYGERPFAGDTIEALHQATSRGELRASTPGHKVPRALRAALVRGLSANAEARFPDLDALLRQLGRRKRPASRAVLAGATLLLAVALGGWASMRWVQHRREVPCDRAAALQRLWPAQVQQAIAARFAAAQVPYARDAWTTASADLDRWAGDWATRYQPVCLGVARERGAADAELHARLACLDRQASNFGEIRQRLLHAQGRTVESVVYLAERLPAADDCRLDSVELATPTDPAQREAFNQARTLVGRANEALEASRGDEAVAEARSARELAVAHGFKGVEAEALGALGAADMDLGHTAVARQEFEQGLRLAEAAREDLEVAIIRLRLLELTITRESDPARAHAMLSDVRASIDRLGAPATLEAEYQNSEAHLALLEGRVSDALPALGRAEATYARLRGADSLSYAEQLYDSALALNRVAEFDKAEAKIHRALALYRKLEGAAHPDVARALNVEAGILAAQQRNQEALPILQELVRVDEANHLADTEDHAIVLNNLGLLQARLGHAAEGVALIRQAIALDEQVHGAPEQRAEFMSGLAELLQDDHQLQPALEMADQSIALKEKVYGKDSPRLGMTLAIRAGILTDLHRPKESVVDLRRALGSMNESNSSPIGREVTRYELARALYDSGQKKDARQVAHEVRAFFAGQGAGFADNVAEVDTWLKQHP